MGWSPTPTVGGIKFFLFTQSEPSMEWNIYHAMGVNPLVEIQAYDDNGILQKAYPLSVIQVDENNVQVEWSTPRKGFASIAATPA